VCGRCGDSNRTAGCAITSTPTQAAEWAAATDGAFEDANATGDDNDASIDVEEYSETGSEGSADGADDSDTAEDAHDSDEEEDNVSSFEARLASRAKASKAAVPSARCAAARELQRVDSAD